MPGDRRRGSWLCALAAACVVAAAAVAQPPAEGTGDASLGLLDVVAMTLSNDPSIALVESRLAAARGALESSRGVFDPLVAAALETDDSDTPSADGPASELRVLSTRFSAGQLLRGGLSLEPALTLERTDDGTVVNRATVSFTFRQPLLRGRGRQVVAAAELAAEREVAASRREREHRIAERLRAAVAQYWTVKAAMLDLEVLRATEASSRELLATTRRLIAGDLVPAADQVQLEADLASREANRIAGERELYRARQDLGREIGFEAARIADLPLPGDPFPTVAAGRPATGGEAVWIERALAHRGDLGAAGERLAAVEILLVAAENAVRPRLDLVFIPSYSGLETGSGEGDFFAPLVTDVPGLSTSFALSWSRPLYNRGAEGQRIEAREAVRQQALAVEQLTKGIGAAVPAALDAVRRTAAELARIDAAVGLFARTLDHEIKKLRAGSSTLVDVITQRDRLTAIERRQVAARLALALALLELRFETGTLTEAGGDGRSLGRENLTTLPD